MVNLLLAVIYISFISLGLPDSLLGAAWPTMRLEFSVPLSYAGAISMIISGGTIISSLMTDKLTKKLGTGKLTALSVFTTAVSLFGFSVSHSYWMLCLWALPYGLGAGSVDASLNNYVALHYASRHMSWLHCMWGVGTTVGPYVMSLALTRGMGWNMGYRYIAIFQIVLTAVIVFSLPLWRSQPGTGGDDAGKNTSIPLTKVLKIPGAADVVACFFCYCGIEQGALLWGSSYLVVKAGLTPESAAAFASLFCIGITVGRAASGFLTYKLSDGAMIRLGEAVIGIGAAAMLLPLGKYAAMAGLILVGLGCAPVFPSIIHATPYHFGAERSQAVIGVEMASAYLGTLIMPPLFGLIANAVSPLLLPVYLFLLLVLMAVTNELLNRKTNLS